MRFEKANPCAFSFWLKVQGHDQAFAKVYFNRPRRRIADPVLREAGRMLEKAGEMRELLAQAQNILIERELTKIPLSEIEQLLNRIADLRYYLITGHSDGAAST